MSDTIHLGVERVIGTGDPSDAVTLTPLIVQWQVPSNCLWALIGTPCDQPLRRLYVLREPVQGHKVLGVCEQHHAELAGEAS